MWAIQGIVLVAVLYRRFHHTNKSACFPTPEEISALSGRETRACRLSLFVSDFIHVENKEYRMPIILWLLGVPVSLILILWLFGVVHF